MTWSIFFGYWGLILVGFVCGCAWVGSRRDDAHEQEIDSWRQTVALKLITIQRLRKYVREKEEKSEGVDWSRIGV